MITDLVNFLDIAPLPAADERHPWLRYQIQEYTEGIRMSDTEMGLDVVDTLCFQLGGVLAPSYVLIRDHVRRLCHRMIAYNISGRGQAPEKVTDVDLFYLHSMDCGTTNVPHLLAQYLFRHAKGRKSRARLSRGHFIGCLAMHFRLATAAGAHEPDEAGQAAEEVAQEISALTQAPPPPPPAPQPHTMSHRIERIKEKLIDASGQTYQLFDSTLVGSSQLSFQRRVRPRIGDTSTSAAPHTDAQPDL
ncbi:hypothetical protein Tco_1250953 [Tanacetum coccineum]